MDIEALSERDEVAEVDSLFGNSWMKENNIFKQLAKILNSWLDSADSLWSLLMQSMPMVGQTNKSFYDLV